VADWAGRRGAMNFGRYVDKNDGMLKKMMTRLNNFCRFNLMEDSERSTLPKYPSVFWMLGLIYDVYYDSVLSSRWAHPQRIWERQASVGGTLLEAAASTDDPQNHPEYLNYYWLGSDPYGINEANKDYLTRIGAMLKDSEQDEDWNLIKKSVADYAFNPTDNAPRDYCVNHIGEIIRSCYRILDGAALPGDDYPDARMGVYRQPYGDILSSRRLWRGTAWVEYLIPGVYNETTMQTLVEQTIDNAILDWQEIDATNPSMTSDFVDGTGRGTRVRTASKYEYFYNPPDFPNGGTTYYVKVEQWLAKTIFKPSFGLTFHAAPLYKLWYIAWSMFGTDAIGFGDQSYTTGVLANKTATTVRAYDSFSDNVPSSPETRLYEPNADEMSLDIDAILNLSEDSCVAGDFVYEGPDTNSFNGWNVLAGNNLFAIVDLDYNRPQVT
jgi:hypothetical protein